MQKVVAIVGPTGVGKTKLSVELAKELNGEIINADSTQVYKGLDVATAKVTESEKEGVPHHLFDMKEITEDYSVYDYQRDCRKKIDEISSRGHLPILVGGTGLYLKAALYNYEFEEMSSSFAESSLSTEELYHKVLEKDPSNFIHKNNRKRLIRALEYMEQTGKPFSEKEKSDTPLYDIVWIGLTTDRETLYNRINKRVDQMMKDGLLEEAKEIYDSNIRTKAILTPIGYKQLFSYFEGNCSLEDALDQIRKDSRHYAKRQYTWFRNQVPVCWFSVQFDHFDQTIQSVIEKLKEAK